MGMLIRKDRAVAEPLREFSPVVLRRGPAAPGMSLHRFVAAIRKYYLAYLFIAVPVISIIIFLVIPMLTSLWWSFNDYSGSQAPRFIGLDNYVELLTKDKIFGRALV